MITHESPVSLVVSVRGTQSALRFENGKPLVLALILGETLALPGGIDSISEVAKPPGATVTVDEGVTTIELSGVGRYHLKATTTGGVELDLSFLVCEQAAHDWIPAANGNRDAIDRRLVLRSLATYRMEFDGTVASLHNVNLGPFGA